MNDTNDTNDTNDGDGMGATGSGAPVGGRRWRRAPAIATAALVAGLPLVVRWAPAAGADNPARPPVFASQSYAAAIHLSANPVPTPFVSELGRGDLPQGSSGWDASGTARGMAATYYPGVAATGGIALACSAGFPCPPGFPPPFPTVASAQYPTTPDASVPTDQDIGSAKGPVEVQATRAAAHAGTDRVETNAVDGGFRLASSSSSAAAVVDFRRQVALLLHGPSAASTVRAAASDTDAVRVDALTAHTKQSFDDNGDLVSVAEATLHGVHLLGGTVAIDAITTTSVARVDPVTQLAVNDSHVLIGQVTVAGQPATIDEHGITIGTGSPEAAGLAQGLNDALHHALDASHTQIVLLSAGKTTSATAAGVASQGQAGGVLLASRIAEPSVPGPVNELALAVQLGQAGSAASAASEAPGIGVQPPAVVGLTGPSGEPGGAASAAFTVPAVSNGGSNLSSAPTAAGTAAGAAAARRAFRNARASVTDGSLLQRVKTLYLVMTLTCLALTMGTHVLWSPRRRRRRA